MLDDVYQLRIMIFKGFDQAMADQLAPKKGSFKPTGGSGLTVPESNIPTHYFVTMVNR
jgi:hypothetical protein